MYVIMRCIKLSCYFYFTIAWPHNLSFLSIQQLEKRCTFEWSLISLLSMPFAERSTNEWKQIKRNILILWFMQGEQ